MILINEWLPNPAGSDTSGEFIELHNDGNAPVSLSGWILKTGGGGKLKLGGTIGAGRYLLLERGDTKLVLKNSDEKLFLYGAQGKLVDQSSFLGAAPEGKSLSRMAYELTNSRTREPFTWADPTPGIANVVVADITIAKNNYPAGVLRAGSFGPMEFSTLLLGVALGASFAVVYAIKKHEKLSKLFFARDETFWQ